MSSAVPMLFNLSLPARLDNKFFFINEENDDVSVSWTPHPDLSKGILNRLVKTVRRLPRAWLIPPTDGEVFNSF
jgi:hypothetical protein